MVHNQYIYNDLFIISFLLIDDIIHEKLKGYNYFRFPFVAHLSLVMSSSQVAEGCQAVTPWDKIVIKVSLSYVGDRDDNFFLHNFICFLFPTPNQVVHISHTSDILFLQCTYPANESLISHDNSF